MLAPLLLPLPVPVQVVRQPWPAEWLARSRAPVQLLLLPASWLSLPLPLPLPLPLQPIPPLPDPVHVVLLRAQAGLLPGSVALVRAQHSLLRVRPAKFALPGLPAPLLVASPLPLVFVEPEERLRVEPVSR